MHEMSPTHPRSTSNTMQSPHQKSYANQRANLGYAGPASPNDNSDWVLAEGMKSMKLTQQQAARRSSQSDSSADSAPIVTPLPPKDTEGINTLDPRKDGNAMSPNAGSYSRGSTQPGRAPPGYHYRGPNAPVTLGKPDEILQIDYSAAPPRGAYMPHLTNNTNMTNNGSLPQNSGVGDRVPPSFTPSGNGAPPGSGMNFYNQYQQASQNSGNESIQQQQQQQQQNANADMAAALLALQAAAAAGANPVAAAYAANPQLLGLYSPQLYGNGGPATPFYPPNMTPDMAAAAAVVANLPPGAFAALQHAGLYGMGAPGVGAAGAGANGPNGAGGPSANNRKLGLYKTELCRSWEEKGSCRYGPKCQFAHGEDELKRVQRHPKYKTEICRTFWVSGSCPYGRRCCFIHTESNGQPVPPSVGSEEQQQANQTEASPERARSNSDPDTQTSMLHRIKRGDATTPPGSNPQPSTPTPTNTTAPTPFSGGGSSASRPSPAALRVDTTSVSINEVTVPKNSYPYTSNPAIPAPGIPVKASSDIAAGRLSPIPATAGPDFGRHAAARMEVVGINSPQQPQKPQPGHLRSVSQTFPSSAIEPGTGRSVSPSAVNGGHLRSDSWSASSVLHPGPISAIDPPTRYRDQERKWN